MFEKAMPFLGHDCVYMISLLEIIDYLFYSLFGFLNHRCFQGHVVFSIVKLNLALLYFVCFVHDDRCRAFVRLFYDYF